MVATQNFPKRNIFEQKTQKMLIICHIDWREVGVAVELQCLRNCTLSSLFIFFAVTLQQYTVKLVLNAGSLMNAGDAEVPEYTSRYTCIIVKTFIAHVRRTCALFQTC